MFSAPSQKRPIAAGIACGLGVMLLWLGGCNPAQPSVKKPAAKADLPSSTIGAAGSNVLFVSVDTTRADYIACYGRKDIKTPNIDRMAAEGARFAQCITTAPLTLVSHSTMMTGSYPFVHGARDNGIYQLPQGNQTLAEILKAAGYTTHAEVAAEVLAAKYGLNQGFEVYGDVESRLKERRLKLSEGQLSLDPQATPVGLVADDPEVERERQATEIADYGIEAIKTALKQDKPFFIFLHFFDPHWPIRAPEPFISQYKEGYLAEIAYFDSQFGRLMDFLRSSPAGKNTLVILVSDHGEGRGQHNEYTHSCFVFDTTMHVPLIMWAPGQIPPGVVVESQVRTVDLAETVLDFVRLPKTPQMQGRSLLPLIEHPDRSYDLPAYSETLAAKDMYGYSILRSWRRLGWKYIHAPNPLLYHVAEDTLELFNLSEKEPQRVAKMRDELRNMIAGAPQPPGSRASRFASSDDSLRALEALGYVTNIVAPADDPVTKGTELDHFKPEGPDPHAHPEEIDALATGLGAYRVGDYDVARKYLSRLLELQPDHAMALAALGGIELNDGHSDKAVELLEHSVRIDDTRAENYRMLGLAYVALGKNKEAHAAYERAATLNPTDFRTLVLIGGLYLKENQIDQAKQYYETAIQIAPDNARTHLALGILYHTIKKPDKAIEIFKRAVALDPKLAEARVQLASALFDTGQHEKAIDYLLESAKALPDNPLLHQRLALLYTRTKDYPHALEQFQITARLLPDSARAQRNLALSLVANQRYDEAIATVRKAIAMEPDDLPTYAQLALACELAGQFEQAAKAYEQVLERKPDDVAGYIAAALEYDRAGQPANAIAVLRRGLAAKLDDPRLYNDLAWRLATCADDAQRDPEQAVQFARKAVDATGAESYNELDTLAAALAANGQFEQAIATAEQALQIAQNADPAATDRIAKRLEGYRRREPYIQQ